jgi:beta-lactamase class D
MKFKNSILILIISTLFSCSSVTEKDFSRYFEGKAGTFVVYDQTADKYIVHNPKRANTRFSPFSTFKIPHSLIALETGVIENVDKIYRWDREKYPRQGWWPKQWDGDHNMRSAIKYSVVPFYRETAGKVGRDRMENWILRLRYGNEDISSALDSFWLGGSLKVSAMEQIDFLRKFYHSELGIGSRATRMVKEILVQEERDGYRFSAKTGAGTGFRKDKPEKALGWYVGYVEKGKNVFFFAMNLEGENFTEVLEPRFIITRAVLGEMRVLE